MNFTDIFVRRPVLAIVVSLLILVLGLRSIDLLPVREYPQTQNAVVTVTTVYTGADPELVSGFITTPLENSIAQANGIGYLTSSSSQGVSIITANMRLNYDANKALTEINTKVNAVLNQLPQGSQQPVISISTGEDIGSMIIGFYSKDLPTTNITDYLIRVVQPKMQAVEGVQTAEILGKQEFALRAWLDPEKMAAHGVTATDVSHFFRIKPGSQGELLLAENLCCLHTFHSLHFGLYYPDQVVGYIRCGQIFAVKTYNHRTDILTCGDTYYRLLRSLRQLIEHSVDLGVYLGESFVGIIVEAHVCGYYAYALRA